MKRSICILVILMLTILTWTAMAAEDEAEKPCVCITVAEYGKIYAELEPEIAPITVENFLSLVEGGFYDGLTFHRIISGFMIQGGDPNGNGSGGSENRIKGEFTSNGVENPIKHLRGVLSMARSSDPDSARSQFFICHADTASLDGNYAAFGRVLTGMEIVDEICQVTTVEDSNGTVARENQPVIESIQVVEREVVDEVLAREAENGRSGGMYTDDLHGIRFPVPEGWNLTTPSNNGAVTFAGENGSFSLVTMNYWKTIPVVYRTSLVESGIGKVDLQTSYFTKDQLMSLIGGDGNRFGEENRAGIDYYRYVSDGVKIYIGVKNGIVMLFMEGAPEEDSVLTQILDHLEVQ